MKPAEKNKKLHPVWENFIRTHPDPKGCRKALIKWLKDQERERQKINPLFLKFFDDVSHVCRQKPGKLYKNNEELEKDMDKFYKNHH